MASQLPSEIPSIDLTLRDAFLQHVDRPYQPSLSTVFKALGPRAGNVVPRNIVRAVTRYLDEILDGAAVQWSFLVEMNAAIALHPDEAESFAAYIVQLAALPARYRRGLREAEEQIYREVGEQLFRDPPQEEVFPDSIHLGSRAQGNRDRSPALSVPTFPGAG